MEQRLDTGLIKGHAYGITAVEKVMNALVSCTVTMFGATLKWVSIAKVWSPFTN